MIMSNEFEDNDNVYEDQEEVDSNSSLVYTMISVLEDEIGYGSTLHNRDDSFAYYFQMLFGYSINEIDKIEELIANKDSYIEIYNILREQIVHIYDKYFGIKFDDIDKIDLYHLYIIYQIVYLNYIQFLCMYALGKGIEQNLSGQQLLENALAENDAQAIDVTDSIVGKYIYNEDEFTIETIARALEASDPGNVGYQYLFGDINQDIDYIAPAIIDNEAFRLRVKYEYSQPGVKYLIELAFTNLVN
jgi:hypothetical protein